MVCPGVPACFHESSRAGLGPMGASGRAPHLSISVTRSRFSSVSVRCVLTVPERRVGIFPGSSGHSSLWSDALRNYRRLLIDTHNTWKSQLHRVGTMIRSTSLEALASLGSSRKAAGETPAGPEPPQDDDNEQQQQNAQQVAQLKASLSRFITTASRAEVAEAAMLSDLSNMAYDVGMISHQQLQDSHSLRLVACSRPVTPAAEPTTSQSLAHLAAPSQQQQLMLSAGASPAPLLSRNLSSQATVWDAAPHLLSRSSTSSGSNLGSGFSASTPASPRTPFVLSSFSEGDDMSDVPLAATACGPVSSPSTPRRLSSAQQSAGSGGRPAAAAPAGMDAGPLMTPSSSSSSSSPAGAALASQLMHFQGGVEAASAVSQQEQLHELQQLQMLLLQMLLLQEQAIMQQLQEQARFGSSAGGHPQQQAQAVGGSPLDGTPADWFVCDGAADAPASSAAAASSGNAASGPVRYFVIQGSITLEHWRINLTIDPCEFEGGALGGVKVHRGVYEAAKVMYDTFVPLVLEHLAAHPDGRIAFTGHSLGGSLATLLMLLLVHRGVLPVRNVATVRTFGSPAIFCEGATGSAPSAGPCHSCTLPCQHRAEREAAETAAAAAGLAPSGGGGRVGGLLARLGLAPEAVVNVIMTRDIVPRAFVCDYTLVANVLKRWLPSFKEHVGLAACKEHKALYNFIGQVEVLQPSLDCSFVLPDEGHFMLPDEAALYKLTEPSCSLPRPGKQQQQQPREAAAPAAPADAGGDRPQQLKRKEGLGGKLTSSFGSLTSLASLGSSSLSSAIADLASSFALDVRGTGRSGGGASSSGGIVTVPVSAAEAAAGAADAGASQGGALVEAALAQGLLQLPVDAEVSAASSLKPAAAPVKPAAAAAKARAAKPAAAASAPAAGMDLGLTLGDAILTFMNSPHPLDTLGEMRAYGPSGQISRFHNPNSYTIALSQLCGRRE